MQMTCSAYSCTQYSLHTQYMLPTHADDLLCLQLHTVRSAVPTAANSTVSIFSPFQVPHFTLIRLVYQILSPKHAGTSINMWPSEWSQNCKMSGRITQQRWSMFWIIMLIILSKAAAAIPTIKPSSTRRNNALCVAAINAYEEQETEFHAFLTSAIPGEGLSGRVWNPAYLSRREVSHHPTNGRLGVPYGRSRRPGGKKDFLFLPRIKTRSLGHPAYSLVTILTELPPPALNCRTNPFLKNGQYSSMSGSLLDWRTIYIYRGTDRQTQMALTVLIITTAELQRGEEVVQVLKTLSSGSRSFSNWQEFTHQWR